MAVLNMIQAINRTLRDEMKRDDKIVILGEDVGVNGGVFRATEGLIQEFGPNRVLDTPLAESGIIGVSIGMALYGLRPVAEIQFLDFIYPGFDQIESVYRLVSRLSTGAPLLVAVAREGPGEKAGSSLFLSQW